MAGLSGGPAMRIQRISAAFRRYGSYGSWVGNLRPGSSPLPLFASLLSYFFLEKGGGTARTAITSKSDPGSTAYLWQVAPRRSASTRNILHGRAQYSFSPRRTGGRPQRFCSARCRRAYELRAWARDQITAGGVTPAQLQRARSVGAPTLGGDAK
jgi:hypothetical protein